MSINSFLGSKVLANVKFFSALSTLGKINVSLGKFLSYWRLWNYFFELVFSWLPTDPTSKLNPVNNAGNLVEFSWTYLKFIYYKTYVIAILW